MARRQTTGERGLLFTIELTIASLVTACGVIDVVSHSCTEIGCIDAATVRLDSPDGGERLYRVELLIDGREVTCERPTASVVNTEQTCSDPTVSVRHEELTDCTQTRTAGSVSESCVRNGKFAQTISIQDTPALVAVRLVDGSGATFQRDFELQYTTSTPNGPDCEPTCHQAAADWVVQ